MQSGLVRIKMILGICGFCKKEFRKREKKYKYCSLICSSRANLNGLNKVQLPGNSWELAEFIGICLGDGYTSKYQTGITLNTIADKEYIPYVLRLAKDLFPGASTSLVYRKGENAVDIRINSRIVVDFLREMGIISYAKRVPNWIVENQGYTNACIRGLIDTEGCISFKQYIGRENTSIYKQLIFRNANKMLMQFVRDNLLLLGLKPTMSLRRSLYLSNDQSIMIYCDFIGFSNPKLIYRSLIKTPEDYEAYQLTLTTRKS